MERPVIAPSAHKHDLGDEAIMHAFDKPISSEDVDGGMTMFVGPDPAGNLLEIGVVDTDEGPLIVDAMPARPQYLR